MGAMVRASCHGMSAHPESRGAFFSTFFLKHLKYQSELDDLTFYF